MNLIFKLERVICTPAKEYQFVKNCKPLGNVIEFMNWLSGENHHITIWTERPNSLDFKLATEEWLMLNQIPYDRLLFDRPDNPVFVNDTPPEAQYWRNHGDNEIVATLFDEWKVRVQNTVIPYE
tara:strand:- start:288 stop:659 length:372 start_codon:yes stop_codon:yes gene_type:complete